MEPVDTSKQTLVFGLDYGVTWSCCYCISVPAEPRVYRTEFWDHHRGRSLELYCAEGEKAGNKRQLILNRRDQIPQRVLGSDRRMDVAQYGFADTHCTEATPPMGQSLLYCGSRNGNQALFQKYKKTQETIAQCFRFSWKGTIQLQEEDLEPFHTWLSWNLSQGPRLSCNHDVEQTSPLDKSESHRLQSQLYHWLSNKNDWESSLLMQILYGLASTLRNLQFNELASLVEAICRDWQRDLTADWDTLMATGSHASQELANFLLDSLTSVLVKTENGDVDFREPKMRRFLLRTKPAELGFCELLPGNEILTIASVLSLGRMTEEIFLRPWALFRKSKELLVEKCPYWDYAARFWDMHYRNSEKTSVIATTLMGKALRAALANEAKRNPESFRYEQHRRILDLSLTYSRKNGFDVLATKSARMGGEEVKEEIILRNCAQVLNCGGQPDAKGLQIQTPPLPDVRLTDVLRHHIAKEEEKRITPKSISRQCTGTELNQPQHAGAYASSDFPSLAKQKLLDPAAISITSKHISTGDCPNSHDDIISGSSSFMSANCPSQSPSSLIISLNNAETSRSKGTHLSSGENISEDGLCDRQFADMKIGNPEDETEHMYSSTSTICGDWEEPHCYDHNDLDDWELLRKSAMS